MARALDRGWAALAEGRWETARNLFREGLAAVETPEGLEGLSWASWWLDDGDAVFDARERAYGAYHESGDRLGAARMATWLASDHLDFHGAFAGAAGWLARANRLLEGLEPGPDHGWVAFLEGYMAYGAGDSATAVERAAVSAEIGRRFAVPDLEMLGLALEGATLVSTAQVKEGMRRLDEATTTALHGEAALPIAGAWTCCFLVTACTGVRDYERAFEWCDRIAEFAERYGSRYMLAFCRAEYGAVHLWRGHWADAESMLEASVEDFSRSRPAMAGGPLVGLAELRRRQGRLAEAEALLEDAGPSSAAQLCHARIALDRGDADGAAELADRFLRQVPEHSKVQRAPALEIVVAARCASGAIDEARAALDALREVERLVATTALTASADLAEGRIAAAEGDHDHARTLFEDAVDRFERSGGVFDAAQARMELAASLAALDRHELAEREAAIALERLRALGAEATAERAKQLVGVLSRTDDLDLALPQLTPRERTVLRLVAQGLTNREIAERLVVSEHTVHRHVTNMLRKLGMPSRAAAAAHAARAGLLDEPGE